MAAQEAPSCVGSQLKLAGIQTPLWTKQVLSRAPQAPPLFYVTCLAPGDIELANYTCLAFPFQNSDLLSQPFKLHSLLANFLAILLEESIIVKLIIVGHVALPWHVVGI